MTHDADLGYLLDVLDTPIPWWQSRGIIGSLVTIAASGAGLIGWSLNVPAATELAVGLAGLIGGALSWWGRVRASHPISTKMVLPGLTLAGKP